MFVYLRVVPDIALLCPSYVLDLDVSIGTGAVCSEDPNLPVHNTNDTALLAIEGVNTGEVLKDDSHYYKYTVQSGDVLQVSANLGTSIVSFSEFGRLLPDTYENTTEFPVDVYVHVSPEHPRECGNYEVTFSVDYGAATICVNDAFEVNDDFGVAAPITAGIHPLVTALYDDDWFSISIADGETIDVSLTWSNNHDAVDLFLYTEEDPYHHLARSITSVMGDQVTYTNQTGGTQDLLIFSRVETPMNGCAAYEMAVVVY